LRDKDETLIDEGLSVGKGILFGLILGGLLWMGIIGLVLILI
jgi:hypothetical protein